MEKIIKPGLHYVFMMSQKMIVGKVLRFVGDFIEVDQEGRCDVLTFTKEDVVYVNLKKVEYFKPTTKKILDKAEKMAKEEASEAMEEILRRYSGTGGNSQGDAGRYY